MTSAKRRDFVPEQPDDQRTPIDEPYYPPIRGGGPADGFTHTHTTGGGGRLVRTNPDADLRIEPHVHPEHGTLQADWADDAPFVHRYQHFHTRDGVGPAIWTGPKWPVEFTDELVPPLPPPDDGGNGGGDGGGC
jgi:hypothetical protein